MTAWQTPPLKLKSSRATVTYADSAAFRYACMLIAPHGCMPRFRRSKLTSSCHVITIRCAGAFIPTTNMRHRDAHTYTHTYIWRGGLQYHSYQYATNSGAESQKPFGKEIETHLWYDAASRCSLSCIDTAHYRNLRSGNRCTARLVRILFPFQSPLYLRSDGAI